MAKKWSVNAKTPRRLASNCSTVISVLDKLEEGRQLSSLELTLRIAVKLALHRHNKLLAAYWLQRAKIKECTLGDENSSYMHVCASVRFRKNQISRLNVDGTDVSSHSGKAAILHDFFQSLLGTRSASVIDFDLDRLMIGAKLSNSQALSLIRPFSMEEIKLALLSMNVNASPGPDGFGPAFFKITSKCLAFRAQPLIPLIIHQDQFGFIKGRGIADNFIYAADIVQTCFKRKKSAIVLKLDFQKAFDSVSWEALTATLKAKGFPSKWCDWIHNLNQTSQSAVLLNGKPGPWISCKKGLRQGDPTSPYLFIIVGDVLQRLIQQASSNGLLSHPIDSTISYPVLQYADDTLIILRAESEQLQTLKSILLQFSKATGLVINFHKSTFAPIHLEPGLAASLASILGCTVASFPQSYLGLPLSTHKLNIKDFFIIDKIDRHLAGWRGVLLTIAGRAILVKAVLRALPIYAMSALLLPMSIVQEIDK
ncbi:hypothetical protein D1007_24676 [Hordeum vulgare]|nr:hypothetical protein D1007_24676 [Hordeum vulgare]